MQQNRRKTIFTIAGLILFFLLLSILAVIFRPTQEDRKAAELLPVDTPATIVNGSELYNIIGGYNRYKNLRIDLANVSRNYLKDEGVGSFTVMTSMKESDTKLFVDGYMKDKSDSISMNIELLDNDRMKITASHGSKREDISAYFFSNSKVNALAATMPKEQSNYLIGFEATTETFVITVYDTSDQTLASAKAELRSLLGDDFKEELYTVNYPTFLGGEDSTVQELTPSQEGLD